MKRPSLSRHLMLWALGALLLVWVTFVAVAYRTGIHEADELTDGHLASVTALLLSLRDPAFMPPDLSTARIDMPDLKSHDYQQSLSVLVWNAEGTLLSKTGEAPVPAFGPAEGFADLELGTPPTPWRSFAQWDSRHTRKVMVMIELQERNDLASDISEQIAEPGVWLLPVVALALGFAIWRGLRPLYRLSDDVGRLEVAKAERLPARHPYREFDSVVHSINALMDGQQAALLRERQLASEVAHELRTPLASLALQAKALQSPLGAEASAQALQRIERDALKAGHVLAQLLSLARASRTELAETAQPVELMALAQRVVAEYAQPAWEQGHELGVSGTADLVVNGHPLLIDMALRNLVENALRYSEAGSDIEIQTGHYAAENDAKNGDRNAARHGAAWLQVCDRPGPSSTGGASRGKPLDALGLGHKIVARVAEVHGGHFEHFLAPAMTPAVTSTADDSGARPWRSCYRLSFAVAAEAAER